MKENERVKINLQNALMVLVIFAITLFIASTFARLNWNWHQVVMFKPALDFSEGKMLFKETFLEYGGLTTLIQSCALKIFGQRLLSIQLMTAVFYALTAVALWYVWGQFLPAWLSGVACLIWILLASETRPNAAPLAGAS